MAKRSQASLSVAPAKLPSRMEPAAGLNEAEAEIWRKVAGTKPIDWFQADSAPLLAEYCRAAAMCNLLADQVEGATAEGDHGVIRQLLNMRDKESRRLMSLGTKLRLTQQSRYTPDKASAHDRKAGDTKKPWQRG